MGILADAVLVTLWRGVLDRDIEAGVAGGGMRPMRPIWLQREEGE